MLPVITDTALELLNAAALEIQAALLDRTGDRYEVVDLNEVLARWLESSIEELCLSACELCVTGDSTHGSFNRSHFKSLLAKLPSVNVWEQEAEAAQTAKDLEALALERIA